MIDSQQEVRDTDLWLNSKAQPGSLTAADSSGSIFLTWVNFFNDMFAPNAKYQSPSSAAPQPYSSTCRMLISYACVDACVDCDMHDRAAL